MLIGDLNSLITSVRYLSVPNHVKMIDLVSLSSIHNHSVLHKCMHIHTHIHSS